MWSEIDAHPSNVFNCPSVSGIGVPLLKSNPAPWPKYQILPSLALGLIAKPEEDIVNVVS